MRACVRALTQSDTLAKDMSNSPPQFRHPWYVLGGGGGGGVDWTVCVCVCVRADHETE